ncbi:MAG TPA: hypothetical protein VFK70_19260 [Vicinamibacteria bacterium]|nr:hypothetical protein [Vicinamibacteria bacterium]
MNIKTAVVAGFIFTTGLGGAAFAQGTYYPVQSGRYATSNQREAQRIVRQAYRDILRREPDASGLAQYTRSMLYDNWTEADVRRSLMSSEEYAQRGLGYGNNGRYSNNGYRRYDNSDIRRSSSGYSSQAADMVRQAYLSTLGREPDAVGLRQYTARVVRDGWTQRDLVRALRASDEYRYRVR